MGGQRKKKHQVNPLFSEENGSEVNGQRAEGRGVGLRERKRERARQRHHAEATVKRGGLDRTRAERHGRVKGHWAHGSVGGPLEGVL